MSRPRPFVRTATRVLSRAGAAAAAFVVVALAAAVIVPGGSGRTIAAEGAPLGSGGEFHSIVPQRIFDTRRADLDVAPLGAKATLPEAQSQTIDINATGFAGMPAFVDANADGQDDNVLAVVVNITVITPTGLGYLRAFGSGAAERDTSVVNFFPGSIVPNTAVLRPGNGGKISLRLVTEGGAGTAHIAVDISGWFSTSTYGTFGSRVKSIEPTRIYDSAYPQFGGANLGDRAQVKVPIRGAVDADNAANVLVPNSGNVVGALVNVTAVNAWTGSKATYVSALPEIVPDGTDPATSTLNLLNGQLRSNMAIVPVGADGSINFFHLQGEIRLVVDLVGYLEKSPGDNSRAGRVVPLVAPFRAFDTREAEFGDQPLGPAQAEDFSFQSFVNDVRIGGEAVGNQVGLLGNLTTNNLQRQYSYAPVLSYMTAYPSPASGSTAVPNVSNVSISEGDIVPNLVLLRYGTSSQGPYSVRFYNRGGYIDYLLDVYAVVLAD